MRKGLALAAALCCLWVAPDTAFAAPFCIEEAGIPPQCLYHDVQSCRNEAAKRSGFCSANLEEVALPEYSAPFCIIETGMAPVCAFQSGEDCNNEASKRSAVCVQNMNGGGLDDPYRFDRPLFRYQ
jgi:hypothetical protein